MEPRPAISDVDSLQSWVSVNFPLWRRKMEKMIKSSNSIEPRALSLSTVELKED